jgi:hypothetical protein
MSLCDCHESLWVYVSVMIVFECIWGISVYVTVSVCECIWV